MWLQNALYAKYSDENKLKLATDGTYKTEMEQFMLQGSHLLVEDLFFGNDLFGRNVYWQLKRIIA